MRRLKTVLWLEGYAVLLALLHAHNGVRTDEAKYLLNIPYPHPPLARWALSLFDGFAWQELAVRLLFATLMVQAAWIVWDMGRALERPARIALCALWLASSAFLLQAGTAMMAPLTALQALFFLWMLSLPRERVPAPAMIGFLWLATLFTALQGALLLPLAVAALRHRGAPWSQVAWYAGAPAALVVLYAVGNPFTMASLLIQTGKDAGDTIFDRLRGTSWILVLAGSGVGTLAGIAGLVLKRHRWILASFALVVLYVFVGRFEYYAILFLPFFVTGTKHLFRRHPIFAVPTAAGVVLGTVAVLSVVPLLTPRSPARYVLGQLGSDTVLLKGSFGHEWQYEAAPDQNVRLYGQGLEEEASVIVCYADCDDLEGRWRVLDGGLANVWTRR